MLGAWSVAWRGRKLELVHGRAYCTVVEGKMEDGDCSARGESIPRQDLIQDGFDMLDLLEGLA